MFWLHLLENLDHHFQKTNRSARRCIWWYRFWDAVWNCQILNQVVASQLFTSLRNKYHQWLSDIELNQISVFSASCSRINPCFTVGKRTGVWNRHASRGHQEKTIFTSIVYFPQVPVRVWANSLPSHLSAIYSQHCHDGESKKVLPRLYECKHTRTCKDKLLVGKRQQ
jgi:hypothetical protein